MSMRATAQGNDIVKVLRTALGDLLDRDVTVRVDLPDEVEFSDVNVTIEAEVTAAQRPDDQDDQDDVAPSVEETTSVGETAPGREAAPSRESEPGGDASDEPTLDDEAEAAADFVEGLLDAMDLPGHLKIRILDEEDLAEIEVVDVGGGALIGRRGQTLEAIQELLRSAMQREFQQRSRVKVDVEGYRARRLEKLLEKTEDAIDAVLDTGDSERLEPMDVFERKAVHRLVGERDGVTSRSQGREPGRRVVIEVE